MVKFKKLSKDEAIFAKFLEQRFNFHSQDMIITLISINKDSVDPKYRNYHYRAFEAYRRLDSRKKNRVINAVLTEVGEVEDETR